MLVTFRSAARTIPSCANIPRAVPACEMASSAYSTWYNLPSGEKMVVLRRSQSVVESQSGPGRGRDGLLNHICATSLQTSSEEGFYETDSRNILHVGAAKRWIVERVVWLLLEL